MVTVLSILGLVNYILDSGRYSEVTLTFAFCSQKTAALLTGALADAAALLELDGNGMKDSV